MKKLMMSVASFAYFFAAFFVLLSSNSHAYIDPSATTFLLQAGAAIVVAVGAMFTVFRHRIAALFKKKTDEEKAEIHLKEDIEDEETDNK